MSKEAAILDVLIKSGFSPRVGSENISIPCPLAAYSPLHKGSRDSRPSMGIRITDSAVLVHCFTCGFKSGRLSYLYSRLHHYNNSWKEALDCVVHLERQYLNDSLSTLRSVGYIREQERLDTPLDESLFTPYSRKMAPYLVRRGVTLDTGRRWGVGVDEERKRAVIPVRDMEGRLWGAVGRTYVDEKPKYLNYWNMKKGKHLLGAQLIDEARTTILVEGSIDALLCDQAIIQAGYGEDYNVLCLLGSRLSDTQAQKIISCSLEVIIALDADEPGERGAEEAIKKLSKKILTRKANIKLTNQKDFGSCSPEQILTVLEEASLIC